MFQFIASATLLTYWLTYSVVQDIIWKADSHPAFQKYPAFVMEPEGSFPCSQMPATGPYPEPAESSRPIDPCLAKVHLNVILHLRLTSGLLLSGPPN